MKAVQAISMFNNQKLYDRLLSVRLDKFDTEEDVFGGEPTPSKLPGGLEGIGKGLGIGGQPLNISKSMLNQAGPIHQPQPPVVPAAGVPPTVVPQDAQAASAAITALTNLAGNLQNLPNLAQSLAQLSSTAIAPGPIHTPTMAPPGYSTASHEHAPPARAPPAYGVYPGQNQAHHPPPSNGSAPPLPYAGSQPVMPVPVPNYGAPSVPNVPNPNAPPSVPSYSNTPAAAASSYSSYDRRAGSDYREEKFRTPDTIYVRNLPLNFEYADLRRFFSDVGDVKFCEVREHGTAIVGFANARDAQRACDLMNGIRLENRPIDVDLYY